MTFSLQVVADSYMLLHTMKAADRYFSLSLISFCNTTTFLIQHRHQDVSRARYIGPPSMERVASGAFRFPTITPCHADISPA